MCPTNGKFPLLAKPAAPDELLGLRITDDERSVHWDGQDAGDSKHQEEGEKAERGPPFCSCN
ncbi:hypothetical protein, partial [Peribacillus sp. SIMBA_075]|uniref:hypothetical protein n=1 Tax=Peribacillus sp. SIMBA_075 TaxID=3085813 RepID=UPI0039787C42